MDDCIIWKGPLNAQGYGRHGGKLAHRIEYEKVKGPIPIGLELDHLCRNTSCVNPNHLEAVTRLENMRRRYATMTHCVNGHEFTAENTYKKPEGYRQCRECNRIAVAAYSARKRAA